MDNFRNGTAVGNSENIRYRLNVCNFSCRVLMQFRTASMSAMLAITTYGVCVGIIAPCLVNFIMQTWRWYKTALAPLCRCWKKDETAKNFSYKIEANDSTEPVGASKMSL